MTIADPPAEGYLDVLSTGHGDIRLTLHDATEEERANAKRTIEDMLRRGYAIYVETERRDKDNKPVLRRVKRFDPKRLEYVLGRFEGEAEAPKPVPVAKTRATAIGATAGG